MTVTPQQRYRYRPELFSILGCQQEELTHVSLLRHIVAYVRQRRLVGYTLRSAWINASDAGIRELFGLHDATDRLLMWDDGQRIVGWRDVLERVHERWVAQG